jgi:dihydrofolate reductase
MTINTGRRVTNTTYLSLDGLTERLQDWHFRYHDEEAAQLAMDDLLASDAILMGRNTYEGFAMVWPMRDDDYANRTNAIPKYVASTTLERADWNNTTILEGDLSTAVSELKQRPGGDIISFGYGPVARELMRHRLMDEVRFWLHPVMVGKGEPSDLLFRDDRMAEFALTDTRLLGSGILVLTYQPVTPV